MRLLAVLRVAVAHQLAAGFPAATLGTTSEHAVGADELMVGIRFPMCLMPNSA
jgi:hypothetical protein